MCKGELNLALRAESCAELQQVDGQKPALALDSVHPPRYFTATHTPQLRDTGPLSLQSGPRPTPCPLWSVRVTQDLVLKLRLLKLAAILLPQSPEY